MPGLDFKDNYRELTRTLTGVKSLEGTELTCTVVDFLDKTIVNILKDGEMDVSYDLQLSGVSERPITQSDDNYEAALDTNITPSIIVGSNHSMKNQVVAAQVGKLLRQIQNKNAILNMSGKLFQNEDFEEDDFLKLKFIVKLVKDTVNRSVIDDPKA